MSALIQPHTWNWFDVISSLLTLGVVLGTLAMASSTARLAKQAAADSATTARLAKAAEDQRAIAQQSEFAARQPVLIPVDPGKYQAPIIPQNAGSAEMWWGKPDSSYWLTHDDDSLTVRLVLRNVGNGVASLPADRDAPEILSTLGRGLQAHGMPSSRTITPGEAFEVTYRGKSATSAGISAAEWPSGHTPAVVLTLTCTDLTEAMQMVCQIWYEDSDGHELRAFKTLHLPPTPVTTPSPVKFFRVDLPRLV